MLKKLAWIGLTASIMFGPAILAPTAAIAQPVLPADPTGHPYNGPVVSGAPIHGLSMAGTAGPATMSPKQCAKEAKAKGLVGKPRKKFLAQCERGRM